MNTIEDAITLAVILHKKQLDKDGLPVIYHPIFVMNSMDLGDTDGRKVAILHDIVEDTDCTVKYLRAMGFANHIVDAVAAITHLECKSYLEYIERVKKNAISKRVKLKDIDHNMARSKAALVRDVGDLAKMKKAQRRIDKYTMALGILRNGEQNV